MNESSASKESVIADEVKVTIEYHGKTYTSTRRATLAALMLNKDTMMQQAVEGAEKCMREALVDAEKASKSRGIFTEAD